MSTPEAAYVSGGSFGMARLLAKGPPDLRRGGAMVSALPGASRGREDLVLAEERLLLERHGERDRVAAREAGGARLPFPLPERLEHPFEREVAEGVGLDERPDLLDARASRAISSFRRGVSIP